MHWQIGELTTSIQYHSRRQQWPHLPTHLLLSILVMLLRPLRFCREVQTATKENFNKGVKRDAKGRGPLARLTPAVGPG